MARIRTIKPDFFYHHDLWSAEHESGLPLRLAYVGMWTVIDRDGRFKWRPHELKARVLPYDTVDFTAVLDALVTYGFVRRYEVDGVAYGVVPSFVRHQVFNVKERASILPAPDQDEHCADTVSEPLGTEGNGTGTERNGVPPEAAASDDAHMDEDETPDTASIVFNQGRQWLQRSSGLSDRHCRSILGRWRRDYGDAALIAVLGAAQRAGPIDAVSWIEKALRRPPPRDSAASGGFNL
jgi:hypothetical protein